MTVTHDDYPHPVPPLANLRWKENWLFVVMAPRQAVYGVIHVNTEPAFDRMRFTCNLSIEGELYKYGAESRFPAGLEMRRELQDTCMSVRFEQPHERFVVEIDSEQVLGQLIFTATHPTFDFSACRSAAPENTSFRELMTLGTNLPHDHHQQALRSTGFVQLKHPEGSPSINIDGLGYRDHSWCMRSDGLIAEHTFCGLLFANRAIGVKTAAMLSKPGTVAREGYVSDTEGSRVIRLIDIERQGVGPDELGELIRFNLRDVYGQTFTVQADLSQRLAHVPLVSEKPGAKVPYRIVENLCPITLLETGETGLGHIELGINPQLRPQ